jgi:hypothetical protein
MRIVLIIILGLPLLFTEAAAQQFTPQSQEETCSQFQNRAQTYLDDLHYQQGYDSLRAYIEKCPFDELAPSSFGLITNGAFGVFNEGNLQIWDSCRDWLKKVLYLNPDSEYYCADLREYALTFAFHSNSGSLLLRPADYKTTIAILKYLADSSHCQYIKYDLFDTLHGHTSGDPSGVWISYFKHWQDTVKDKNATPFDSTLPPLDSIGMGWLRGFQRAVKSSAYTTYSNAIGELRAVKNPFTNELELELTTTKPTVAKLELYDALGWMLWSEPQGYLEPMSHRFKIAASDWSSGTYYARVTTLQGEVKTCKVVKE